MTGCWFEWRGEALLLHLKVQPRSAREGVEDVLGDRLRVRLNAPPVDDKANSALIALLAKEFGVARGAVAITQGSHSRLKTVALPREATPPAWFSRLAGGVAVQKGTP